MIELLLALQLQGQITNLDLQDNKTAFLMAVEKEEGISSCFWIPVLTEILDRPSIYWHKTWKKYKRWDYVSPLNHSIYSVSIKEIKRIERLSQKYNIGF